MFLYGLIINILQFGIIFGDEEHQRVIRQNGIETSLITANSSTEIVQLQTVGRTKRALPSTTKANSNTDYSQCGKSEKKTTPTIQQQNTTLGDWPWMVGLGYRSNSMVFANIYCGGILISNQWVLTAAYCVRSLKEDNLDVVRFHKLDLNDKLDVPIAKIIPHPEYCISRFSNNIALVRLAYPVAFTKLIRPICVLSGAEYSNEEFYSKKLLFTAEWGGSYFGIDEPIMLREIQVKIIDNEKCAQNYSDETSSVIDQRVLCALLDGNGFKRGLLGGALIMQIENTYNLAGIFSYGEGYRLDKRRDSEKIYPLVYTKVAHYADWIKRTAGL